MTAGLQDRKTILFFFILSLVIWWSGGLAVRADEIPVKIKAETLKFSEEKNLITATGSVEIIFEGLTIFADRLEMDTITNIVTAEGNVKMFGPDYDATGKYITYFTSNETASFYGFKSEQSPPNIKGKLYLLGEEITDLKTKMIGKHAGVTTCNYNRPHHFAIAKKVEYYPNDKVIGFGVTFYQGWIARTPVMWAPYLYYDLKKRRKRNWTIGNNQVEGDFVKTVWDSPLPWAGTLLFMDWMDKKGIGYGIQHDYAEKSSAYLYHLEEKDTRIQDWVIKLNHHLKINQKTNLELKHESQNIYLIPSGRSNKINNKIFWDHNGLHRTNLLLEQLDDYQNNNEYYYLKLNHRYKGHNTNYTATLDQKKLAPRNIKVNQRLSHSQPLFFGNTKLKTNLNYNNAINAVGEIGDQRLNADYTISHSNKYFDMTIYEDYYFDLDGDEYSADSNLEYLEKQPEITLSSKSIDFKLFRAKASLGYGWYHEVKYVPALAKNRDFTSSRYMASLDANKNIPLLLGTTLGLGASIAQFMYEPGDQRYAFSETISLNTSLWNRIRNRASFNRKISEGNSPFFFDTVNSNYSNAKETLSFYYKNNFDWTTSAGYNFNTKKYDNLTTGMTISPTKKLNLLWRSGYDINNKRYLDLTSGISVKPLSGLTLKFDANQDINIGVLKTANSLIDLEIGSEENWLQHWHIKLGHVYDPTIQDFKLRDVMVVKDLHCWEVKYLFSDYRKEYSITFTLKALPEEPLGYTPSRGYYFEGFEKSIKEEFKQDSLRRY